MLEKHFADHQPQQMDPSSVDVGSGSGEAPARSSQLNNLSREVSELQARLLASQLSLQTSREDDASQQDELPAHEELDQLADRISQVEHEFHEQALLEAPKVFGPEVDLVSFSDNLGSVERAFRMLAEQLSVLQGGLEDMEGKVSLELQETRASCDGCMEDVERMLQRLERSEDSTAALARDVETLFCRGVGTSPAASQWQPGSENRPKSALGRHDGRLGKSIAGQRAREFDERLPSEEPLHCVDACETGISHQDGYLPN